jgi:hypothetical protein
VASQASWRLIWPWLSRPWPRLATGTALGLLAATFFWQQHRATEQKSLATTMHAFAPVAALGTGPKVLSVEVFQDFDTIQKLVPERPMADVDLLAALHN